MHAETPGRGEQFAHWNGDTQILKSPRTDEDNEAFTISRDVTITAIYSALPSFTVTVTSGTGDGSYFAGDTVQIGADAASSEQFTGWTGNVAFSDALSPTTTFTMPVADVMVTATYGVEDEIRYYPRAGFLSRMIGGVFEGTSDDPLTGTYTPIYAITTTPPLAWTTINVNLGNYRYLRYRGPKGSYGNVAEIEFYRNGMKINGTAYGTSGSWRNQGNTFEKALDGDINTNFDGPTAGGNYVGIDRRAP